jgi:hypothetical protein
MLNRETEAMLGKASPLKPSEPIFSRSSKLRILLVAWRDIANINSSLAMPQPSSTIRMSRVPPASTSTVIDFAAASRLFSTSSLMTEDGRSTTSPAAIWLTKWEAKVCIWDKIKVTEK